jgi:threonine dehydrogenase-like Zn-dependent dehydrogenase
MKSSRTLTGMPYVCASCRRSLATTWRRTFAATSRKAPDIYDVVTVGGGPVGLALLAALSMSAASTL